MSKTAIVVGSGIAGISSAIRLANKGYDVQVFEANSYPGGKLTELKLNGFRFDAGPSLFTMPNLIEELFDLSSKNIEDYFSYSRCDVSCKYFFEDGLQLTFYQDEAKLFKEVESKLNVDSLPLRNQIKKSKFIYDNTSGIFMEKSLHKLKSYLSFSIIKSVLSIPRLRLFKSLHESNVKALNHPKLIQIFDRYATYNGSSPYKAPGVLSVIPHIEHGIGTYFPKEGMHSITLSLVKLAEDLGVKFNYNEKVQEIITEGNRVLGVKSKDKINYSDVVICNSDVKPAYKHLLKGIKKPLKTLGQEPSSSAMIFYWGINKQFEELDLHNIFFSEEYEKEFNAIFEKGEVIEDPTVYINITSKKNQNDAPIGMENWFVMINVPYNSGQDWLQIRKEARKNIIKKLNSLLKTNLEDLIIEEDFLDPVRIESRTSSFGGALYGASSNDRMAAFFRHPNFSKIKGLFFVGGSVHPGGGIPLCLLSSKIVDSLQD